MATDSKENTADQRFLPSKQDISKKIDVGDVKKTKRERDQVRRLFNRQIQHIEENLKIENVDSLEVDMEFLQERYDALKILDTIIQDALLSSDDYNEKACNNEFDECEKYKLKWLSIRKLVLKRPITNNTPSTSSSGKIKLPQLEIIKFDDNPKTWIPFWGQYRKIHENPTLDDSDKYQYLIQSMQAGSKARSLVESYAPTSGNYENVLKMLKERFAKDEVLIETYVRELLRLVMSKKQNTVDFLYDRVIANLQTLETLGIVKDKYECILYPLVESALPENTLLNWSRVPHNDESKLSQLLDYLKMEVDAEERLKLAKTDFIGVESVGKEMVSTILTAACLTTAKVQSGIKNNDNAGKELCYFCDNSYNSIECYKANKLSLEAKKEAIKKKGGCYICLKRGHLAKQCKAFISCLSCTRRHLVVLCPDLHNPKKNYDPEKEKVAVSNLSCINTTILLQTLIIKISNNGREKKVRALLDSGSQRTYIKAGLAVELGLDVAGNESLIHSVFGDIRQAAQVHRLIEFMVSDLDNSYSTKMIGLEQITLCGNLPKAKLQDTTIIRKLKAHNVHLTDLNENISEISILIGSDYLGSILETDFLQITDNLVAIKTKLGWTLQGPIQSIYNTVVNSFFVGSIPKDDSLEFMWNIELLGIKDPYEKDRERKESEILTYFNENISVNREGRYEVRLIWKFGRPKLQSNYDQAYKRLLSTTRKLEHLQKKNLYHEVFQDWLREGIIEVVKNTSKDIGVYLPHHAVIKMESSTTKVRPVMDASARDKNNNSLNSCIEKCPNLIELIPKLLILFRIGAYAVTSDIRKAFLQISVYPEDREYLKILWWSDPNTKEQIVTYQHARVPFGVACSPFLLAATINYHLEQHKEVYPDTIKRLKESFYVDNCIASFNTIKDEQTFIKEATEVMKRGQFDLRGWLTNSSDGEETTSILGLLWNRREDNLLCHINLKNKFDGVTKRDLLSVTQQIFDPLGFASPVTLVPKLLTQKAWFLKIGWDDKIPKDLEYEYMDWISTIHYIKECRVPRRLTIAPLEECETSVHIFCDASKDAYAGCIFLRTKYINQVTVQLILAKSRVAPIKKRMSLPRLELMGALIASRLYTEVLRSGIFRPCKDYGVYCWTDSSVVIAWLKRHNTWKTFVSNRVIEICKNTNKDTWNHLPGTHNPADLPSRGCTAKVLLQKHWWTGPQWLYLEAEQWPKSNLFNLEIEEEVINSEQAKSTAVFIEVSTEKFSRSLLYFSKFNKIVRLVARLLRFSPRIRQKFYITSEHISYDEYKNAEETLIKLIQKEHFVNRILSGQKLCTIEENGIIKVKTRLELSYEEKDFIYPILLPGKEEIVSRMVQEKHQILKHAGTQLLMCTLRNSFWIIGVRRLVKKIVADCIICKRYKATHYEVPQPPLPSDRISSTAAFEVTGIDLAGPLFLKDNSKCWIVLFTCAVYRAIHLELTESLSTASFIMSLRRFIARRGRVKIIYTDNGTNFVGTANLLQEIDWDEVETATNSHSIRWKFSVPAAPWWGGWWERLVRVVKEILRRILGKSVVNWIELTTILCDCEVVVNSRPLTYVEMGEYRPLTPMMFLHNLTTNFTADLDHIDHKSLNIRYKYLQQLRDDFRKRFRNEYLSLLISKGKEKRREPKVGEVVLIETDSSRLNWPLGIIKEIFVGKDGFTRSAKVQTSLGDKVRAYQKLYPLELNVSEDWINSNSNLNHQQEPQIIFSPADAPAEPAESAFVPFCTRSGRTVKLPSRFLD